MRGAAAEVLQDVVRVAARVALAQRRGDAGGRAGGAQSGEAGGRVARRDGQHIGVRRRRAGIGQMPADAEVENERYDFAATEAEVDIPTDRR